MTKTKTKKLPALLLPLIFIGLLCISFPFRLLAAEEGELQQQQIEDEPSSSLSSSPFLPQKGHSIHFDDIPVVEFIRFVSKISETNFIYNARDLAFNISLSTGRSISAEQVVQALIQLLSVHGFVVHQQEDYYVIHPVAEEGEAGSPSSPSSHRRFSDLTVSIDPTLPHSRSKETYEFLSYKLQYHEGGEIEEALKKIGADLKNQPEAPAKLINAIHSLQWVRATNSLLCSADPETLESMRQLIQSVDIPLRQVFIEVLVIETDVKKGMEFGLQWAAGGQSHSRFGGGLGNFQPQRGGISPFAGVMQGVNGANPPTGLSQLPLVPGFDLGVIGDIIMHKGKSFLSLGALVSALQVDGDSTIVLNQKIITQDNKNSKIFVGDNIPFTGSVVQTIGQGQQTSANIEYRDIGVSLSITPRLGEGDVVTLDLQEEITESLDNEMANSSTSVNGIRTTKTNMATHVHVPDQHFLILSGMIRNHKGRFKAGLPCLGGLPFLGTLFSKTKHDEERRNVVIFVRPHIIRSAADYEKITESQEALFESQANPKNFSEGVQLVAPE